MKTINKIFWSALILLVVYTILVLVPTPVNFSITGFVAEGRLPTIGGDSGNWGSVLNTYLTQEHTAEGGHKNVTVQGSLDVDGNGNFTGDLNITGNLEVGGNANITGNLTIGDKITFRLGGVIDNLVDGIVKVTGSLNISLNLTVNKDAKFENDVNITGNLVVQNNLTISGDIGSGTPDANTLYAKSLPKAWVNFNGDSCTGTFGSCGTLNCAIRGSFNVECVDRVNTGTYDVYWDRDFANENYVVSITVSKEPGATVVSGMTGEGTLVNTNKVRIHTIRSDTPTSVNSDGVYVIAFGEQ